MRSRLLVPLLSLAVLLALVAGSAQATGGSEPAPAAESAKKKKKKKRGVKLTLRESGFGAKAVMNGKGRVLYLFTKEGTSEPQCYGECAVAWPPFLTKGKPVAGKGLNPKLLRTTARTDGTRQVTYGGHPLYYYEHDTPGVILCQDVFEFGGDWLIVDRRGKAIR